MSRPRAEPRYLGSQKMKKYQAPSLRNLKGFIVNYEWGEHVDYENILTYCSSATRGSDGWN
jgi:hypothetical protein